MKPHLWKLGVLAGLIWLGILISNNRAQPAVDVPADTGGSRQTVPASRAVTVTPIPGLAAKLAATSTPSPTFTAAATPTVTPTPVPVLHPVQPGEVPGQIAALYGISVEKLMQTNHLTDPTTLQIGQLLLIPVTATAAVSTPNVPKATPIPTVTPTVYIIKNGDTLLAVAAQYETTVEAIMIANNIANPRSLQIGQELIIPSGKGSILGVPTVIHQIRVGDTLLGLAVLYGSTVDDILASNPELEPTRLQIDDQIIVPLTQPKANPVANPLQPRITAPIIPLPGLMGLEQAMTMLVNEARQEQGLQPLTTDETLTSVARAHAQDMVSRGYFSHVTPEGIALRDRLAEHGLTRNWVGENIQRNVQPHDEAAAYAFNWFMGSRPHRNNILHDHYQRIGVGVAEGPPGWYTFVLVFAEN